MGRSFHNCRLPTKIEEILVNERGEIKKDVYQVALGLHFSFQRSLETLQLATVIFPTKRTYYVKTKTSNQGHSSGREEISFISNLPFFTVLVLNLE